MLSAAPSLAPFAPLLVAVVVTALVTPATLAGFWAVGSLAPPCQSR
jgi:hypothetical protein